MSFELDPRCNVGNEMIRVMRAEITKTMAIVRQRRFSAKERIHRIRTTTKKLRAALKLAKSTDPKLYRRENRRLGQTARTLSSRRDADAMLDCWASLLDHYSSSIQRSHFRPIQRALLVHRHKLGMAPNELKRGWREATATLRASDRSLARWRPEMTIGDLAADLRRNYKRARHALNAVYLKATAGTFHEFRKGTKVYAYQCRLLRAAWPSAMKELHRELKALGRGLGDEHDLNVLECLLEKMRRKKELVVDEEIMRAVLGLIDARRTELRSEAIPLGQRLFADRPSVAEKRMREWWSVARVTLSASTKRHREALPQ